MDGQRTDDLSRMLDNWAAERDSIALYGALAKLQRQPAERATFEDLERAERRHAEYWEQRLRDAGCPVPAFRPSLRTRMLIHLARYFGADFVIPSIVSWEVGEGDRYSSQTDARAAGLAEEERSHAARLRRPSHVAFGNNLRASVLGANDDLSSNFCLMMGVAGAGISTATILLTGIAGLVGGACSMALGEWLSVTNARELALSQLDRQSREPACDHAHATVAAVGDALSAAGFSALLFALGALVPLLPFALLPASLSVPGCIAASLSGLLLLGLATSLFTSRSALFSAQRQVVIGAAAAALTYLVGHGFGALIAAVG